MISTWTSGKAGWELSGSGEISHERMNMAIDVLKSARAPTVDGCFVAHAHQKTFDMAEARAHQHRAKIKTARRGVPRRGLRSAQEWVRFLGVMDAWRREALPDEWTEQK